MDIFKKSSRAETENTALAGATKKCKYCKEDIIKDAKACRFCGKKQPVVVTKKMMAIVVGLFILYGIAIIATGESSNVPASSAQTASQSSPTGISESPAQAQKDLDDFMALSEKSTLVTSYDLSSTQDVVYVSDVWYGQTVQFKKDFMAKIAMLRDSIDGRRYLEVRDAYSNEKVGEVTAFSGSIEVYQ